MIKPAIVSTMLVITTHTSGFAQDVDSGEKIFKKCASCHQVGDDASNKTGPVLSTIIGRTAGTFEGFKYSKSMIAAGEAGLVWDEQNIVDYIASPTKYLRAFLDNPRAKAKMRFKLKDEEQRRDVAAYLASFTPEMSSQEPATQGMQAMAEMDTPGKLCVTNGADVNHFFVVETPSARITNSLEPGGVLCSETTTGGKVSVFETADDLEGCTRIVAPNHSDTLIKYAEFDRCAWASNVN